MALSLTSSDTPAPRRVAHDAARVAIEIADSLGAVEATWRAFEREAIASPYQRFDWVQSFAEHMRESAETLQIVTLRDVLGRPLVILPLVVARRGGLKTASPLGGKHANFNLPLLRPGFGASLQPAEARALLVRIGRALAVDLLVFRNAPLVWADEPNPLTAGGRASPSNAYKVTLAPDADATLVRVSSGPARKKLRNKERSLAKLGEVGFLEATNEAEVDLILDQLLRQKSLRFRELGIDDPYASTAAQRFVRDACLAGLAEGRPAIALQALTLDGAIIAALGSAADGERLSGMFISFEAVPEIARCSPGEILVSAIIRRECERGRTGFDLGVGEARYKRVFCNEVEQLADNVVGITAPGKLYGAVLTAAIDGKRWFKANPRAMRLLAWMRRARSSGAAE
jgi:CelD/BcsL family acetyltransferase involved in cellulose biosynthesis